MTHILTTREPLDSYGARYFPSRYAIVARAAQHRTGSSAPGSPPITICRPRTPAIARSLPGQERRRNEGRGWKRGTAGRLRVRSRSAEANHAVPPNRVASRALRRGPRALICGRSRGLRARHLARRHAPGSLWQSPAAQKANFGSEHARQLGLRGCLFVLDRM